MVLFEQYNLDIGYVLLGTMGFLLLLFILLIISFAKQSKLKKKYRQFMSGADGKSLEAEVLNKFSEVEEVKHSLKSCDEKIGIIEDALLGAYQKVGIVKYDAFKEIGGNLSFSLALLNEINDGFIINAMHSRDACYTYIKEIKKGESAIKLAQEEKEALDIAKACK